MEQRIYDTYVHLLERELVPAMGCTEPIAVAYAAAVATRELGVLPETVDICVSANIIKNVKGVTVPNTGGLHGLKAATARENHRQWGFPTGRLFPVPWKDSGRKLPRFPPCRRHGQRQ